ncbi:MAG: RsiV family protein [Bacteroidia bacterium]|nr:RsiV family protein [Bacteroidia bacterium]
MRWVNGLVIAGVVVVGCTRPPAGPEATAGADSTASTQHYDTLHFRRGTQPGPYLEAHYLRFRPESPGAEALNRAVVDFLVRSDDQYYGTLAALADSFLALARREAPASAPWYLDYHASCLLYDTTRQVATLAFATEAYLGGAHPLTTTRLAMYDLATGKPLPSGAVLTPTATTELLALAERHFRAARGLLPGQSLEAAGFAFPDGRFAQPQQVALGAEGLVLYYGPYEVGPYALGSTEFTIPYGEVNTLLLPRFRGPGA